MVLKISIFGLLLAVVSGFSLLPPTGKYIVGTTTFELVDNCRQDPFAPIPSPRDLMLSVFYPAQRTANHTSSALYLLPQTAAIFADGFGVSKASLQSLMMNAVTKAPYDQRESFPILLFSPGFRVPRVLYGALAENLASYGYLVITIDHPYDSILVEYPDGRVVMPQLSNNSSTQLPNVDNPAGMNQAIDVRVQDLSFVLDQLQRNNSVFAQHIPNFPSPIETSQAKVGVLGHSLGGASSATVMLRDRRFLCGACLDGKMSGSVIDQGLDRPFLLMGAEGNTRTNVAGWLDFWANLRSFRRHMMVKGSAHSSFEDISLLAEAYASVSLNNVPPPNLVSDQETIKGSRMREIMTVYVDSLFDMCFKKGSAVLLDGSNLKYPEVTFEN